MKDSGQLAYTSKNDSIGLDFGMRNLITTSKGDLIGRNFIDRLREYDKKIIALRLANPQFFMILIQKSIYLFQDYYYMQLLNFILQNL